MCIHTGCTKIKIEKLELYKKFPKYLKTLDYDWNFLIKVFKTIFSPKRLAGSGSGSVYY